MRLVDFGGGLQFACIGAQPERQVAGVGQRDQIGFAIGYHLQLARNLAADLGYRHSWYFYNDHGRTDLNQVFSLALRYYVTKWAALEALVSGATNNSNHSVFDYDVFSTGGGVGLTIRF